MQATVLASARAISIIVPHRGIYTTPERFLHSPGAMGGSMRPWWGVGEGGGR